MAEGAAGRASGGFGRLLQVLVLVLWSTLPTADFLEVEMAERTQIVFLNDNATIFCKVPGSPHLDIKIMGIIWFWKSRVSKTEVKLFEFFGDHQAAFRPGAAVSPERLERGDASLQLPVVQLGEAGEYRCEVVITPEKAEGSICLEVLAYPVSSLFLEQGVLRDNEDKRLLCKSSGFYPENINITWKKWTQKDPQYLEVSEGITTGPTVKNADGTFNVTSFVMLTSSLEDGMTIYQCEIWHISMPTSQRFNFTLIPIESKTTHWWITFLSVVAVLLTGLILLILFWCLWRR